MANSASPDPAGVSAPPKFILPKLSLETVGPISFKLYAMFINHGLHKIVPTEEELEEAGLQGFCLDTPTADKDGKGSLNPSNTFLHGYRQRINRSASSGEGSSPSHSPIKPEAYALYGSTPMSRLFKFLAWSDRMYVRMNKSNDEIGRQVVSLMLKKTGKEIIPKESFREVIMKIHTRDEALGECHLPLEATVDTLKREYTYGRRDFGMTEETIRDIILQCQVKHCYVNEYGGTFKVRRTGSTGGFMLRDVRYPNPETILEEQSRNCGLPKDSIQFYNDIAQILVHSCSYETKTTEEQRAMERKLSAVRRDASISLNGTCLKRKAGGWSEERGSDPNPYAISSINDLNMELAYHGIVKNVLSMKSDYKRACSGARSSYESLCKSMNTVEMLLHRCRRMMYKREAKNESEKSSAESKSADVAS